MNTLRELLEGKTLPVRVSSTKWRDGWVDVKYLGKEWAYGPDESGDDSDIRLDEADRTWTLVEPKRPRLLAWMFVFEDPIHTDRPVSLAEEGKEPKMAFVASGGKWVRAQWLDEPEGA